MWRRVCSLRILTKISVWRKYSRYFYLLLRDLSSCKDVPETLAAPGGEEEDKVSGGYF